MPALRWFRLLPLALVALLALGQVDADAQVFRPRGGKSAAGRTAPAPAAAKKTPAASATPSRKPTRAPGTTPRRITSPKKAKAKAHGGDDVKIQDDEEDVKITDDE